MDVGFSLSAYCTLSVNVGISVSLQVHVLGGSSVKQSLFFDVDGFAFGVLSMDFAIGVLTSLRRQVPCRRWVCNRRADQDLLLAC